MVVGTTEGADKGMEERRLVGPELGSVSFTLHVVARTIGTLDIKAGRREGFVGSVYVLCPFHLVARLTEGSDIKAGRREGFVGLVYVLCPFNCILFRGG